MSTDRMCDGRVCVVTGAGRGLGRAYAVDLAGVRRRRRRNRAGDRSLGGVLAVAEGWHRGPSIEAVDAPQRVGPIIRELLADARPRTLFHEIS